MFESCKSSALSLGSSLTEGVEAVLSDAVAVVLAVSTTAGLAAIAAVVGLGDLLPGVHVDTYVGEEGWLNLKPTL